MIEEGRALFLQIAEQVEDSIIDGALPEDGQAPSTNELAAFYRINPATAAKGIGMLVDKGILYKRRGIGMFVTPGARELPPRGAPRRRSPRGSSTRSSLEARKLALDADELAALIRHRGAPTPWNPHQRRDLIMTERHRGERT